MKKVSKILILGGPGSGKTSLANKLAKLFELPIINLDNINYKQNWITQHWLPVSLLVQAAIVAFELLYAVHILYSKRRGNYREIRLR